VSEVTAVLLAHSPDPSRPWRQAAKWPGTCLGIRPSLPSTNSLSDVRSVRCTSCATSVTQTGSKRPTGRLVGV
jgi:hypothetical protein